MMLNFEFDKEKNYKLNGIFEVNLVKLNFPDIPFNEIYQSVIDYIYHLKKMIIKYLSNDDKLIGQERADIVRGLDELFIVLLSIVILKSEDKNKFSGIIDDSFSIFIETYNIKHFRGNGFLHKVSEEDVKSYDEWFDNEVIFHYKNIINYLSDKNNNQIISQTFLKIIYNILSLRYKIEFF